MTLYRVLRDSGRRGDRPNPVHVGGSEEEALRKFEREVSKLRQGAIELEVDDKVVRRTTAPRLRIKW